jgi:hypothetical protein
MTLTILAVTYSLKVPVPAFRERARKAAFEIADVPGLRWKIWGLDDATGEGTSVYLFSDRDAAEAFATGPAIAALRDGPAKEVAIRLAPVERDLSAVTHAARALSSG